MNETAIAVRALCDFAARAGDLDLSFLPRPSAREGIAGHQRVAQRRPASWQAEVSLSASHSEAGLGTLQVRGRADGVNLSEQLVEEVKTRRGDTPLPGVEAAPLHWAQARVYGHMLCQQHGWDGIHVRLTWLDIDSDREHSHSQYCTATALQQHFEQLCRCWLNWHASEARHRLQRDAALRDLRFPWPAFRKGQRELAEAVYQVASTGRTLLAQAPTGSGKTLGTLFPLLKAMPLRQLDKVIYLTSKSAGRQQVMRALHPLRASGLRLLELQARDKACVYPDRECRGESCPLARGFHDRLPGARADALLRAFLDQQHTQQVAQAHQVCPYYLQQELQRWADLVVADCNYWFDRHAALFALSELHGWRTALLVDEAHNLPDRARRMYSAGLSDLLLGLARQQAPAPLRRILARLLRHWRPWQQQATLDGAALEALPPAVRDDLQQARLQLQQLQVVNGPDPLPPAMLQLLHALNELLEQDFGEHGLWWLQRVADSPATQLEWRTLNPAPLLRARWQAATTRILCSATLSPWFYYADVLGLPEGSAWIEVDSPFAADQLQVVSVNDLSTRWQQRAASLPALARLLAGVCQHHRGNWLAFFPSFAYLEQAARLLAAQWPQLRLHCQQRHMSEAAQQNWLQQFQPGADLLGLAVLGGAFAEAIDLPGSHLQGVMITTLGLPQVNAFNETLRQHLQQQFGAGFDYAYTYPGLQKVVQAAGRLIRHEDDRGILYLLDERFSQPRIRALLPATWPVQTLPLRACPQALTPSEAGGAPDVPRSAAAPENRRPEPVVPVADVPAPAGCAHAPESTDSHGWGRPPAPSDTARDPAR